MIIDFHTHVFPDAIAGGAVEKLSRSANIQNYSDGTHAGLVRSMQEAGIDMSIILPVATKPTQTRKINQIAIEENQYSKETGLLSFGAIHPDNEDYKELLREAADAGIKGIKIHPVFTNTYIDDIRYERIIAYASELGLTVLTHGGYDISSPELDCVTPEHLVRMIDDVQPQCLIIAHMGGWGCYEQVLSLCQDKPLPDGLFLDTSFSYFPLRPSKYTGVQENRHNRSQLTREQFVTLIHTIGAEHVLFGSDSPWSRQKEAVTLVRESGLTEEELDLILYKNALALL